MVFIILYFRGNLEVAQVLLHKDVNVNAVKNKGNKETPLHDACMNGHVSTAQLLLEHGADRTIRNGDGLTAFQCAKSKGHTEVTELF